MGQAQCSGLGIWRWEAVGTTPRELMLGARRGDSCIKLGKSGNKEIFRVVGVLKRVPVFDHVTPSVHEFLGWLSQLRPSPDGGNGADD